LVQFGRSEETTLSSTKYPNATPPTAPFLPVITLTLWLVVLLPRLGLRRRSGIEVVIVMLLLLLLLLLDELIHVAVAPPAACAAVVGLD